MRGVNLEDIENEQRLIDIEKLTQTLPVEEDMLKRIAKALKD